MLIKDDPLWCDIKSDVLKIDELLEEIRSKSVTGFVEFDFLDFSSVIFLDQGEILQCIKVKNEKEFPVTKPEILKDLKRMVADVGVYRLKKEVLHIMCGVINDEIVFDNMSSKFVDIKQLLLTLERDTFSGIVAVKSEKGECFVKLEKGFPVNCICQKTNEKIVESLDCLDDFLDFSQEFLVSVYREREKPHVITMLKKVTRDILGDNEKIEKMLEDSGTSKEELLKTVEEIEKVTYLFLDKKKAGILSQRLKETIEEVIP